jgi:hypothetical protein
MQNTIYLLYKYLKNKNYKVSFYGIKTNNIIDPVLNLSFKNSLAQQIKKRIKLSKANLVFVNTSKILSHYQSLLLDKERFFKIVLVCHDLYYFRKKYFNQIKVKDKTELKPKDEINVLKKVNYIIDYSKIERDYMIKKKINEKKFLRTFTPTNKFRKININKKQKYDILYISSNWLQNKLNIKDFLKKINYKKTNYKFLIIGDLDFKNFDRKKVKIKKYSFNNLKSSKIGIAIMNNGTGRKTKIFEMLGLGIPTFTNVNLSEFGLRDNKHYKLMNKKLSINKQIGLLLRNFSLRKKLSTNSYNWSRKHTTFENAFKAINKII